MSVRSFTESECAVVGVDESPGSSKHTSNARKNQENDTTETKANQTRRRQPTPYPIDVERFRHEGVSQPAPKPHEQQSSLTPSRNRVPTPHPRVSDDKKEDRNVHWAKPLKQKPPKEKKEPLPEPVSTKSAMKKRETKQKGMKSMVQEEDQRKQVPEAQPAQDIELTAQNPHKAQVPDRQRRSSIPLPKRVISKPIAKPLEAPKSAASPLIPEPATRKTRIPILSSASAKEIMIKTKQSAARDFSFDVNKPEVLPVHEEAPSKTTEPTTARDFSFVKEPEVLSLQKNPSTNKTKSTTPRDFSFVSQPEVLSVGRQQASISSGTIKARDFSFHPGPEALSVGREQPSEKAKPATTRDFSFVTHPEVLSVQKERASVQTKADPLPSQSSSYLQAKPKRCGAKRPIAVKPERRQPETQDRSANKDSSDASASSQAAKVTVPGASVTRPTSNQSFNAVKSFWAKETASDTSGATTSKLANTDMKQVDGMAPPAKLLTAPAPARVSSFQSVKSFWSGLDSSSRVAVVDGSSSQCTTPGFPSSRSSSSASSKTSIASAVSSDVVNGDDRSEEKKGTREDDMAVPVSMSALSSGMEKIDLNNKRHVSIYTITSDADTVADSSKPTAPSTLESESIPSIESDIWNEIMDFCASESSLDLSLSIGKAQERDDDYDERLLEEMKLLVGEFGMVALVEEENDRAIVKEE
ncbi:hypothetical protein B0T20DRAFT_506660 [Sordaria brevicollis]|uniref:Uncharacterized protein n=1 Tax=Sordaria brevicollis TaxID=83679 RepID=A0AAE0UCT3_SORBR|nr:hypothetical protein B0T20DRAFT_506660 [Sordaria brevicollis]